MRHLPALCVSLSLLIISPPVEATQSTQDQSVPRLITITGVYRPADGKAPGGVETVTLSVYADEQGGAPLFQETQQVTLDDRGRYSVVLGAAHADGVPASVFASGQWLGTVFERTGEIEGPRVRLTSVPFAMRAIEADTLGGHPASDYVLSNAASGDGKTASTSSRSDVAGPAGTVNFLAKFVDAVNLGDSGVYENNGQIGIGTTVPLDFLTVRYNNTNGAATGIAVQNLGNTATSYSGMLFYDQNGTLGQFQGFNNVTHEYRINNIAKNGASQFDGSINFMLGSTSRFFVGSGAVGIGTTSPAAPGLEVSNALTPASFAYVAASTYGNNAFGSAFVGTKSRGTQGAPAPVQHNDQIALFGGGGRAATHPGAFGNGMSITAAENFTDAAQGTVLNFSTTALGTNTPATRVTISDAGDVGVGTSTPAAAVDVVRSGDNAEVRATTFNAGLGSSQFMAHTARGTAAAPAAVQLGDELGFLGGNGYGTTHFSGRAGGMDVIAAENWTDAAMGSLLAFFTTPLGVTGHPNGASMAIMPDGSVGIGSFTQIPTITDKLQVFGDVRVGTTGTNGCIKNFAGTGIIGTCSSDRRLKKNITPFAPMLDNVTALQPVHYFWRSDEFPDRHFGNGQNYGLIAQDVEQVLPELVATDSDGYKAVDYSKLPLLTIQAMKELKAENDALKQQVSQLKEQIENDPLSRRVAELERVIAEMLARQK